MLNLRPSHGIHSYKAVFAGSSIAAASTSSASALAVTSYPSTTTIAESGSAGNYTLTATVVGWGNTSGIPSPTGTVAFQDTNNGNYLLATAPLGTGTLTSGMTAQVAYSTGTGTPHPYSIAAGDFNGDGIPDLAVANSGSATVSVLLGSSTTPGTFAAAVSYTVGTNPYSVAVGDFNGDGIPDLVVANEGSNTVSILLGSSTTPGTFATAVSYSTGTGTPHPYSVAVGDFNGDGILDLAVANENTSNVSILLGSSTTPGTFAAAVPFTVGTNPYSVAVGDFNEDGILDLAVADEGSSNVSILLGIGTGSFQAAVSYTVGTNPHSVAVGDFNGDGIPDVAVANAGSASVSILLGASTTPGTFGAAVSYTVSNNPYSIAVGDFNGDGIPDLAVVDEGTNKGGILLGSSTTPGTFGAQTIYSVGSVPYSVAVGDFNGDGLSDLAVANENGNTLSIIQGEIMQTATASVTGISPIGASGTTHSIVAGYSGDANYEASTSGTTSLTAKPVTTTLTLAASPSTSIYGQQVMLTATLSPYTAEGDSTNGESVTFYSASTVLGTGVLSSGVATLKVTSLPAGLNTLSAQYASDGNFAGSSASLNYLVRQASSVKLSLTSGGSTVTSVASGSMVTLTAAVTSGGLPVTAGKVNFCDAIVASCTDMHLLGSAQLTSAGTAVLNLRPGVGSHSYKAVFAGASYGFGTSSASALTVTGLYPTTSTIAESGSAGNYALTATVTGYVNSSLMTTDPSGPVSFVDTSNSYYVLGTASLVAGTGAQTPGLATAVRYLTGAGSEPTSVAVGDFNGDGIPDLAVADQGTNNVSILQGNGDGTFQTQVPYGVGTTPVAVAVGDFNGDGVPDLAVVNSGSNNVSILLGSITGAGSSATSAFTLQSTALSVGTTPMSVAVGDFNGDGILDLAVANSGGNTVSVFLGNENGTFVLQGSFATGVGTTTPYSVAVGDFNGDGIADLAVANEGTNNVGILLGTGTGSFQAVVTYATGTKPYSVTVGDFRGIGTLDLAVANYSSETISILLGSGAGTFAPQVPYPVAPGATGISPRFVAAGDFNGDGKLDLVTTNFTAFDLSVFYGNGDGTFQTEVTHLTLGPQPTSVAVGDFNGDGLPDLVTTNEQNTTIYSATNPQSGNDVSILLSQVMQSSTATVTGISPVWASSSTHLVDASYPGDTNYGVSTANQVALTAQPVSATLTLTSGLSSSSSGQSMTLTATLSPYSAQNHSTNNETVTFYSGSTVLGTGVLNSGLATLTVGSLSPGVNILSAQYNISNTDNNFAASTSNTLTYTVPAVTWANPAAITYGTALSATQLNATASVAGTFVYTPAVGTVLSAGIQNLNVTFTPNDTVDYLSATATVQITVDQMASTVTLSLTSSGSAVTGVASGNVVALTAAVTASGSPLTAGQVNFCDATATYCADIHLLGTAQLTSAGTAVVNLRPGIGAHSYKAVFVGTTNYVSSATSASALVVTGPYPTTTTIAKSGSVGNYALTATVVGVVDSSSVASPTGSVSFLDTTDSSYVLGSASLGTGAFASTFASQTTYPTGSGSANHPYSVAVGDFNGDGFPDLAVTNNGGYVSILLASGTGTFTPMAQSNSPSTGYTTYFVAVGDFNRDGKPDLAVANSNGDNVGIFLGNGDGTFASQVLYPTGVTGSSPVSIAVGDFNRDGIQDLAVANQHNSTVSIFIGNGDGTFTLQANSPASDSWPGVIVTGDFNGDGILDLATSNQQGNDVSILQGNGDGTFQTARNIPANMIPNGMAVGDFNGDGIPDLAVGNTVGSSVCILLGQGNGSFALQGTTYRVNSSPTSIAVGDFDGDGILDLAVTNATSKNVSILRGLGGGAFAAQVAQTVGAIPYSIAAGDFNGDGVSDLAISNESSGTTSILLGKLTETATATVTGVSPVGASGSTHLVDASYSGDTLYGAGTSGTVAPTVQPVPTGLALTASSTSSTYGRQVTLTATLSPYSAQGYSTNNETVTFYNGSTVLGTGVLTSGAATLTISSLPGGTDSLSAQYNTNNSDSNFISSTANLSYAVNPATPTVSVGSPSIVYAAATASLTASIAYTGPTAPTGAVRFAVNSTNYTGICSPSTASTLSCMATANTSTLDANSYPITVNEAADANYAAASGTGGTLTVAKATATITLGNLTPTYTGSPLSVTATTAPQGLSVSISYNGSSTPPTSAGSYPVTATVTDSNYTGTANGRLLINQATPGVTWSNPAAITYGTALSATQLNAAATVPGSFVYSPAADTVLNAGANQTLNAVFTPMDTMDYTTVTKTVQITVALAMPAQVSVGSPSIVYGTASAALPVTISYTGTTAPSGAVRFTVGGTNYTSTCTVSASSSVRNCMATANTVALAAGSYPIVVKEATDADYAAASGTGTLSITRATPAVLLVSSVNSALVQNSVTLTATVFSTVSTPTGSVTFLDGPTPLGTVPLTSGIATLTTSSLSVATHAVMAVYSGDSNFFTLTSMAKSVLMADFRLTSSISSQTVLPGGTASYSLTLSPLGSATFPSAIQSR